VQGSNEWMHNSPGDESLWKRQITAEGAEKLRQCYKHFLQCNTSASEKTQVRTWGRQTCSLPQAPSNLVMPLVGWYTTRS